MDRGLPEEDEEVMVRNTIKTKAMNLYESFAVSDQDDKQDGVENGIECPHSKSVIVMPPKSRCSASASWFYNFLKRYDLKVVCHPRNDAFANTNTNKTNVNAMKHWEREISMNTYTTLMELACLHGISRRKGQP